MTTQTLEILAATLGERLRTRGWQAVTAESCTGGWIAETLTAIAGSSDWFDRGFVTYSNDAKQDMLGVRAETLQVEGAVSEAVVKEMAVGALQHSQAQIAVSVSGIAGPSGGSANKPVGTVWIAWATSVQVTAKHHIFTGDRYAVRQQSVEAALLGLLNYIEVA